MKALLLLFLAFGYVGSSVYSSCSQSPLNWCSSVGSAVECGVRTLNTQLLSRANFEWLVSVDNVSHFHRYDNS